MIQISNEEARNFLVSYQNLNGPAAAGHEAVMEYMRKVRCIQFDPLNVVGRNPDLVLQARVKDYRPEILEDLLYRDRELIDAADKMLSIRQNGSLWTYDVPYTGVTPEGWVHNIKGWWYQFSDGSWAVGWKRSTASCVMTAWAVASIGPSDW